MHSGFEKDGDQRFIWDELVGRTRGFVLVFVKKRLHAYQLPLDLGEDVVQKAYLVGWRKRQHFFEPPDPAVFLSWIMIICKGEIKNVSRSEKRAKFSSLGRRRRIDDLLGTPAEPWAMNASPQLSLEVEEGASILERALATLSSEGEDLVRRHHFEGVSFKKLASERGVSVDATRMQVSRYLEKVSETIRRIWRGLEL